MKDKVSEDEFSPKLKSPSKSIEEDDDLDDDDVDLSADIMQRKFLNFRELKNFHSHLCKLQAQEIRNSLGKNFVESFLRTNALQTTFVERVKRPENYKKMCELQLEEVKKSELYQKLNHLDKTKRGDGPKQYSCSKCGQPKRGHVCTATDDDEKGKRRRLEETLAVKTEVMKPKEDDEAKRTLKKRHRLSNSYGELIGEEPRMQNLKDSSPHSVNPPQSDLLLMKSKTPAKVVVIGAGIAGITAARELRHKGFDVTVVEGRERIGGRIHTITSEELKPGCGIDIGASFIYDARDNPLVLLCSKLGLRLHQSESQNYVLYDTEGNKVNSMLDEQLEKTFNAFVEESGRIRGKSSHFLKRRFVMKNPPPFEKVGEISPHFEKDVSFGSTMNEVLLQWQKNNSPIANEQWNILNWYFTNIEGAYGSDLSNLSLLHWDQDDDSKIAETSNVIIPEGFGHVINSLAQGLDIKLNHKVDKINYESNIITVETSKGTMEANYVVSTLPLGILKEGKVIFSPPLPHEKQVAIGKLGFGLVNKLVLFFSDVFWDKNEDFIGSTSENRGEFYMFINMFKVVGTPVLVGLIAGSSGQSIESRPGEDVVSGAMNILRRIYKEKATNPTRAVVTRWASDPFALGAFSYLHVGASADEYDVMAKPIDDKIFFAGEATHREHPSSVTGAYLSGLRVANEIIRTSSSFTRYSQTDLVDNKVSNGSIMRCASLSPTSVVSPIPVSNSSHTMQENIQMFAPPLSSTSAIPNYSNFPQLLPVSYIHGQAQPASKPYLHSEYMNAVPTSLETKIGSQVVAHTQMAQPSQTFSSQTIPISNQSQVGNFASNTPYSSPSLNSMSSFSAMANTVASYNSQATPIQSVVYSSNASLSPTSQIAATQTHIQPTFTSTGSISPGTFSQISSASQQSYSSQSQISNFSQEQMQQNNFNPQASQMVMQGGLMNSLLSPNADFNLTNEMIGNLEDTNTHSSNPSNVPLQIQLQIE